MNILKVGNRIRIYCKKGEQFKYGFSLSPNQYDEKIHQSVIVPVVKVDIEGATVNLTGTLAENYRSEYTFRSHWQRKNFMIISKVPCQQCRSYNSIEE